MQCLFLRFIFYNIINWAHYAIILTRNALIEARKAISQYSYAIPSFGLCQIEQSFCFAEPAKVKPLSEESG
jgi:hypothetical protein